MTQTQVELCKEAYRCDFDHLQTNLLKREVNYIINESSRLTVKKRGKQTVIWITVDGKRIKICKDIWTKLCNLKESVLFLHSFIEDH